MKNVYFAFADLSCSPPRVTIHAGKCSHCNFGKGRDRPERNGRGGALAGEWTHAFDSVDKARAGVASGYPGFEVKECRCLKRK